MNSEELEQSLRTEFESYLKTVLADMRQEVSEFQKKFEAEFEKHKSQLDEVFRDFSERFVVEKELDAGFTESVLEHLRLSRDEGARITATAIAEAEEMEKAKAAASPKAGISEIRDAINDISSKNTQSSILKSLVTQAANFTPRGAFFIIKNEHLVGWRVYGKEGAVDEQTVREIFFPVSNETLLGEAVRSLTAVESSYGTFSGDQVYLNKLQFGQPNKMFAIPLMVRGRAVAVLYADHGNKGGEVNLEALETLVRVASLTVEVLASSRGTQQTEVSSVPAQETNESYQNFKEKSEETAKEPAEETVSESEYAYQFSSQNEERTSEAKNSAEEVYESASSQESAAASDQTMIETDGFAFKPSVPIEEASSPEFVSRPSEYSFEEATEQVKSSSPEEEAQPSYEEPQTFDAGPSWNQPVQTEDFYSQSSSADVEAPTYEVSETQLSESSSLAAQAESSESVYETTSKADYQFEADQTYETPSIQFEETPQTYETQQYEAESYAPASAQSYGSYAAENGKTETYAPATVETVSETVAQPVSRSRFKDRNVDLPIDVSEDERRLHNDARRFARLLVSEIKLYNEQKVREGREAGDLYERLREAIDRSREMYDKRVQPPVAAKFDYFHYELVTNLAEGDEAKFGPAYPGAAA